MSRDYTHVCGRNTVTVVLGCLGCEADRSDETALIQIYYHDGTLKKLLVVPAGQYKHPMLRRGIYFGSSIMAFRLEEGKME